MNDLLGDAEFLGRVDGTFLRHMHPDYSWACVSDFLFTWTPTLRQAITAAEHTLFGGRREQTLVVALHQDDDGVGDSSALIDCAASVQRHFGVHKYIQGAVLPSKWFVTSDRLQQDILSTTEHADVAFLSEIMVTGGKQLYSYVKQELLSRADFIIMESSQEASSLSGSISRYAEMAAFRGRFGFNRVYHSSVCQCEVNADADNHKLLHRERAPTNDQGIGGVVVAATNSRTPPGPARPKQKKYDETEWPLVSPFYRQPNSEYEPNQVFYAHPKCGL